MQLVCPGSSWYVPPPQLVHAAWLASGLKVPGAQGVGRSEPTEHEVPGGQVMQSETLSMTATEAFLCLPAGCHMRERVDD